MAPGPERARGSERYTTDGGKVVRLAAELARGGEAIVYRFADRADRVAKIYVSVRPTHHDKLRHMRDSPPADPTASLGHASIAWPEELLFDRDRHFAGYVMPFIRDAVPILAVSNPRLRATRLPGFDRAYLHRAARNLASAIAAVHGRGYVIGDLNERNVLVTPRALVSLIDADSFQVQHPADGRIIVYPCPVGRSEYTAPELQGQPFLDVMRRPEHDGFGLGVLLFQLLMDGGHPFRCLWRGDGDPPPIEQRIARGWFPHGGDPPAEVSPPPGTPAMSALHPLLADMMVRCFVDGHRSAGQRPTADEWSRALAEAERHLVACTGGHLYDDHERRCPVCGSTRRAKAAGDGGGPVPSSGPGVAVDSHTTARTGSFPTGRSTRPPAVAVRSAPSASRRPRGAGPLTRMAAAIVTTRQSIIQTRARYRANVRLALAAAGARAARAAWLAVLRPGATVAAAGALTRRLLRLSVVAGGAAAFAAAVASAPVALEAWPAVGTGLARPEIAASAVAALAMLAVGTFRGLANGPDGRVTAPLLGVSARRAAAGLAGAGLAWVMVGTFFALMPGGSPIGAPAGAGVASSPAAPSAPWVAAWALYGAVAGTLGPAIRDRAWGWFLTGSVFGTVGAVVARLVIALAAG